MDKVMEDDLLERAKKALIGKYFIIMHEGLAHYGTITYVRMFRVEYVIEIKWNNDGTRSSFYYSEEDMEALLAYGLRIRKDNKVTYILYSESNFISCLCKQVVSAESTHTTNELWKERWWDVFFEYVRQDLRAINGVNRVELTNETIQDAMQGINEFFKDK